MNDPMLPLPGLSPVSGKRVEVKFDGGLLSSDGGVVALREVEQRLRVADRLAGCLVDPRAPDQVTHSLADIIRFRLLMISAGYEDGVDANSLRNDPMFKMALVLAPSDRELGSQSTISRLENLPYVRALARIIRAIVDLYCASFTDLPKPITLVRRAREGMQASRKARSEGAPGDGRLRRFKEFYDGGQSWGRVERIVARVEVGAEGPDTRFVVTNLNKSNPRALYEDVYCRRGQAENHIKSWKTHLAAARTSCSKATANQLRLFLHAGAYWLLCGLRAAMRKHSMWRSAQFHTRR